MSELANKALQLPVATRLFVSTIEGCSRFTPPLIAHGRVYVATSNNELLVYGLH